MPLTSIMNGRVPQFVFSIALALGVRAVAGERAILVASPNKAAASGMDDTVYEITSNESAIAIIGQGFPGHRIIKSMLAAEERAKMYVVICPDNAATASTKTHVLGGAVTVAGVLKYQIADEILEISVTVAEPLDTIGAAIVAEGTAHPDAPVLLTYDAGTDTVTSTAKGLGAEGDLLKFRWYDLPTGLTVSNGTGNLAGGTGSAGWSTAFAAAFAGGIDFDFVVPATNVTATLTTATTGLRDRIQTQALPANGKPMNVVLGYCTTGAAARTAADSFDLGTNDYTEVGWRFQGINAPVHFLEPWCIAGAVCAVRAVATQGTHRNDNWPGIWPGSSVQIRGLNTTGIATADYPTKTDWNTDLSNGISPLAYDYATGTCKLVGSCTMKHVTGGAYDYRASWTNHIDVMDGLAVYCTQRVADAYPNKLITDDVAGRPPENLGENSITPSMIKTVLAAAYGELVGYEWVDATYVSGTGVTTDVCDLFVVERDATVPNFANARVAAFVRDWFLGAGIMYEEYGAG